MFLKSDFDSIFWLGVKLVAVTTRDFVNGRPLILTRLVLSTELHKGFSNVFRMSICTLLKYTFRNPIERQFDKLSVVVLFRCQSHIVFM